MNPIVYHIVSGHAFFSRIGLILLTVTLSGRPTKTPRQASRQRLICITSFLIGRIQRSLSSEFHDVLADRDSTLDTIHLSSKGNQRMADLVWSLLQKE